VKALAFDNRFTRELPADPNPANTRRQVFGACFSRVSPRPVARPELAAYSREVAALLGFDEADCVSPLFAEVFSGTRLVPGMDPFAMCYGGHQFGSWAGQLGDGRAINLGEVKDSSGERWMLQLKGAGPTPYSRTADGLAVLRSSVREFLCSEAMHHLGVPTTRALSLVLTGEQVVRDMFYDGNPRLEPGAVVCRVAQSFLRFGNFEIFAARGDLENLRRLADFTIRHHYPHLGPPSDEVYAEWFREVCRRTAETVVHWMRVGFVHGVMNTDNMSILGETIDYGPYGWLEDYDPQWTPNTTDAAGRRYCFGNQPGIAQWNLCQLANAILQLTRQAQPLQDALDAFAGVYEDGYRRMIAGKLGLDAFDAETDGELVKELFSALQLVETDMTIFFRRLADVAISEAPPARPEAGAAGHQEIPAPLLDAFYDPEQLVGDVRAHFRDWCGRYAARVRRDGTRDTERRRRMNALNPKYVLRNYLAQLAIDKAEAGDHSMIAELLEVLRRPYDEQLDNEEYARKRPDWARSRPGCSMLSCSS
jgi:uncharacterized protein YdiU (UPF0061 family)